MKQLTKEMIRHYRIKELNEDFMGYSLEKGDIYTVVKRIYLFQGASIALHQKCDLAEGKKADTKRCIGKSRILKENQGSQIHKKSRDKQLLFVSGLFHKKTDPIVHSHADQKDRQTGRFQKAVKPKRHCKEKDFWQPVFSGSVSYPFTDVISQHTQREK